MADIPMPQEIIDWMRARDWGQHHLRWHVERIWGRLPPASRAFFAQRGWSAYPVQEGEESNGLEFLAMHRVMLRQIHASFPQHAALLAGWTQVPTDPDDANDPVPPSTEEREFRATMRTALERLVGAGNPEFDGEDALGLYIQTEARPFPAQPRRRSADTATGLHNYLHGRWQDDDSAINLGDPEVNLENQRFWSLHGWIDGRWTAYREATGRSEGDPRYVAALREAEQHMGAHGDHGDHGPHGLEEAHHLPIPAAIQAEIRRELFSSAPR